MIFDLSRSYKAILLALKCLTVVVLPLPTDALNVSEGGTQMSLEMWRTATLSQDLKKKYLLKDFWFCLDSFQFNVFRNVRIFCTSAL